MHASLALWNRTHGARYANVRYWWRIEPDVLYAGNLRALVEQTAGFGADLLVPKLTTQAQDPEYGYWAMHEELLRQCPPAPDPAHTAARLASRRLRVRVHDRDNAPYMFTSLSDLNLNLDFCIEALVSFNPNE